MNFDTSTICKLAGLEQRTYADWKLKGIITPAVPGEARRGAGDRYSLLQAVGIAVGATLRRSKRGCALPYVREIVDAFASMPEPRLRRHFISGRTHFTVVHRGLPLLGDPAEHRVNVEEIYNTVKESHGL
jgi:hypothetical protein